MSDEMDIEFYCVLYVQSVSLCCRMKNWLKMSFESMEYVMVIYITISGQNMGPSLIQIQKFYGWKNSNLSPHVRLQEMAPPVCPSLPSR